MNLGRLLIEAIKRRHEVLSVIPVTTLTATITRQSAEDGAPFAGLVSLPISDATARELLGETLEEGHRPALLLFIHIPGSVLNELEASEAKAKEERPRILTLVGGRR